MALNDITFIKGQGGLGRALAGEDYISGILFYSNATLPSGFTTTTRIQQVFSIEDAENLGIVDTYTDETKAQGQITITVVGADGDIISASVAEPKVGGGTNVIQLGSFTKTSAETTVTLLAAAFAAVINAGTVTHGYTASPSSGIVTITARAGLGIALNTGAPLAVSVSGTLAATVTTAFAGGVGSQLAVWHYHIKEYFRLQPQGNLYVGIYAVTTPYTFNEITTMQIFAKGKIRQIAIYKDSAAYAVGDVTLISNVCKSLDATHMPLSALYAANMVVVTNLATLSDLGTLTANKCSVIIGQDGGALGATLFMAYGKSVTNLGATLGAVSLSTVSESIAWIQKFNISDGFENDTVAFANGNLYSALSTNLINQLNSYRYIFLTVRVGITGSFFNDNHTAIAFSSDYAYINDNRVIDKAIRGVYANMLPALNSSLTLNSNGTLTDVTAAYLQTLANVPLDDMLRNTELSDYEVTIDQMTSVQTTSKVFVTIKLIGIGIARNIEVKIGYATSL
jgi:hypothetical protein